MMKSFCAVLVVLLIGGCASSYVAPPPERASRLRISVPQSEASAAVVVRGYPSGQCDSPMSLGMVGGIARYDDEQSLGIPGHEAFPLKTTIERMIPASSPYLMTLRGFHYGSICYVTFQMTPVKGDDYEVNYSWRGGMCHVRVERVARGLSGEVVRTRMPDVVQAPRCTKGFS